MIAILLCAGPGAAHAAQDTFAFLALAPFIVATFVQFLERS